MEDASSFAQISEAQSNLHNVSGSGEISVNGNLAVAGSFMGKLNVSGCLVVDRDGVITGEFRTKDLQVYGRIIGKVYVSGQAEMHAGSRISGRILARELIMHPQAVINGGREIENLTAPADKQNIPLAVLSDQI
jgi:cytoskeletal protein CcmA (bactofilin family)